MSRRHSNICQFSFFSRPRSMLSSPEIKMFEKQVETDRDGGFKSSASRERSRMRQKLSAGVGGRRGAVFRERAFFFNPPHTRCWHPQAASVCPPVH